MGLSECYDVVKMKLRLLHSDSLRSETCGMEVRGDTNC